MPDKQVYEYAMIRVVPRVEREEFLNVGVILSCKKTGYIGMQYHLDRPRLQAFAPDLDLDEIEAYLQTWERICQGDPAGGPMATLDSAERFRLLSAPKSTILQCSPVHPGLTNTPELELEKLFQKYVC